MSESKIKMTVFRRSGRKFFECQWVDPVTGLKRTQSTGKTTKKEADREAGKLLDKLESGRFREKSRLTWDDFCDRHETEVAPSLTARGASKFRTVFDAISRIIAPKFLRSLDATQISQLQKTWREEGLAEASIKGYLSCLASALNWAKGQGLITEIPAIGMPSRTAAMKGRPITLEEFERMLQKTAATVTAKPDADAPPEVATEAESTAARVAASWKRLLRGLWLSGLRIEESTNLHWTDDRLIAVAEVDGELMLRIRPDGQKSGKDTLTPIAPEFEEFLRETPEDQRRGFVFCPLSKDGKSRIGRPDTAGKIIRRIGKAAGVKVKEKASRRKPKGESTRENSAAKSAPLEVATKYASAHDFRRAFGFRWAMLVMPAVLQQLMRHESISTTMEFYVGRNAKSASAACRDALKAKEGRLANTSANSRPESSESVHEKIPQPLVESRDS